MPDIGLIWTNFINSGPVQLSFRFIGLYALALYVAMLYWTIRDAQKRTDNRILPFVAGLLVLVFNILGLFVYLILRDRETLSERYEQQLAEEGLLAEAEKRRVCPVCATLAENDYLICPVCRMQLRNKCTGCSRLVSTEWDVCPYCAREVAPPKRAAVSPATTPPAA